MYDDVQNGDGDIDFCFVKYANKLQNVFKVICSLLGNSLAVVKLCHI